jgi:hypothetical protein
VTIASGCPHSIYRNPSQFWYRFRTQVSAVLPSMSWRRSSCAREPCVSSLVGWLAGCGWVWLGWLGDGLVGCWAAHRDIEGHALAFVIHHENAQHVAAPVQRGEQCGAHT